MPNELQQDLKRDQAFWQALHKIDPLLLMESAEELTAGAKCLQALRHKGTDLQKADWLVLDCVVGSIRRSVSRTLTHLDEADFAEAYERHRRYVEDVAAKTAQTVVADHMDVEVFDGVLSRHEQNYLVQDVREKKGSWLWERSRRGFAPRFTFGRIREFIDGIRNHWLLRPAGLGVAFIAYDIAVATSTFADGEISSDKIIVVAKELPSIPMGLAMIASPFLQKRRGQEQERNRNDDGV